MKKIIERRINKLENQFGCGQEGILVVVGKAGRGLALDQDRCVQILEESGFLPAGAYGLVNLCSIPAGLNAEETESFLRENAAEICGRRQNEGKP